MQSFIVGKQREDVFILFNSAYSGTVHNDWSIKHWNTKWNSYGYDDFDCYQNDNTIRFETAWTAPHPVLVKLSEMYPDIGISHQWADEDSDFVVYMINLNLWRKDCEKPSISCY